jgi:uncharacterized membrane protein
MDHKKPLIILTGILAFTIILLSSVFHYAYSIEHYESELSKTTMRIPLDGALDASRNVIGFFRDDAQLDKDFFNTQEINHLDDVKTLLTYANIIYMISIMLFWAVIIGTYLLYRKGFSQFVAGVFFTSGIISVATILLLGLATIINFDAMFLLFHMLFFCRQLRIRSCSLQHESHIHRCIFHEHFCEDSYHDNRKRRIDADRWNILKKKNWKMIIFLYPCLRMP